MLSALTGRALIVPEAQNSSQTPTKRLACERCRAQKLKCVSGDRKSGVCARCKEVNAKCEHKSPGRSGRPSRKRSNHGILHNSLSRSKPKNTPSNTDSAQRLSWVNNELVGKEKHRDDFLNPWNLLDCPTRANDVDRGSVLDINLELSDAFAPGHLDGHEILQIGADQSDLDPLSWMIGTIAQTVPSTSTVADELIPSWSEASVGCEEDSFAVRLEYDTPCAEVVTDRSKSISICSKIDDGRSLYQDRTGQSPACYLSSSFEDSVSSSCQQIRNPHPLRDFGHAKHITKLGIQICSATSDALQLQQHDRIETQSSIDELSTSILESSASFYELLASLLTPPTPKRPNHDAEPRTASNPSISRPSTASLDTAVCLQLFSSYLQILTLHATFYRRVSEYLTVRVDNTSARTCGGPPPAHHLGWPFPMSSGSRRILTMFPCLQLKATVQAALHLLGGIESLLGLPEGCRVSPMCAREHPDPKGVLLSSVSGLGVLEMNVSPSLTKWVFADAGSRQDGQDSIVEVKRIVDGLSELLSCTIDL